MPIQVPKKVVVVELQELKIAFRDHMRTHLVPEKQIRWEWTKFWRRLKVHTELHQGIKE